MKKILAALLTLALLLGATFAMADAIVGGTNAEFAPFEYIGDDGEYAGFDMELIQYIAEELGMELKIENMYFDGLLSALEVGTIDLVISAMTITEERKQGALFSDPYFVATQAVIVKEGYEGIKAIADIADKKVAVQDGTTGHFMVQDDFGVPAANIESFKASTDTVLELNAGRVDCIVIDDAVAQNFLNAYEGLTIVQGLDMPIEEYGMAIQMGNDDLLAAINGALAAIKADGRYDELIAKYFAE